MQLWQHLSDASGLINSEPSAALSFLLFRQEQEVGVIIIEEDRLYRHLTVAALTAKHSGDASESHHV